MKIKTAILLLAAVSSSKLDPDCPDHAAEKGLKKVLETIADGVLDPEPTTSCGCTPCPCGGAADFLTAEETERATHRGAKRAVKEEVDRF